MKSEKTIAAYEIYSLFKGGIVSYLVGFYVFAFYLELHTRISFLQSIRFQFIFGAFLGLLCLAKLIASEDKSGLTKATKMTFLLIGILGIYAVFSFDTEHSRTIFIDRVIKFSLVSFFIYAAVEKVEDLRVIVAFMLLAWLKIGQEGIHGWITGGMMWENQGIPRLRGVTTMFAHPNSYSGFAVGCLPFALFLIWGSRSYLIKAALLALVISALVIVVNTGSRTGYVATIIWGIYFFTKIKVGKVKIFFLLALCLTAILFLVPEHYKERFNSIFTGEEREGRSSEKRKEIISDAVQVYLTYPMGVGVSAFPAARQEMFGRSQDTHNLYLEVLTNIGPLGFLVFILFICAILSQGRENNKIISMSDFCEADKNFLRALGKAVVGFLLARLLLGLFGMDLYEIYWWLALGYILAIAKLLRLTARSKPSIDQ